MKTYLKCACAVLALSGAAAGTAVAVASARDEARAAAHAADLAGKAGKALAKHDAFKAVRFAEAAVAAAPQDASYRALLGQSYLAAGRFTSAQQALGDALTIDPTMGKAALSLALAEIGNGDWAAAHHVLDANAATIPAADRGLALALAGDPNAGVEVLMQAARGPDSSAKVRQNLALAMALAGRWQEAKVIASADLSPAEVDTRMQQWAAFAHPASASDQVAAILGVAPIEDGGQPVALALNPDRTPTAMAAQSTVPTQSAVAVDAYMPGQAANAAAVSSDMRMPAVEPSAAPVTVVAEPVVEQPAVAVPRPEIVRYAVRREVAQPVVVARMARLNTGAPKPVAVAPKVAARAPAALAKGRFFVQLGAYSNARSARVAWSAVARRHPALASHMPSGASVKARGVSFYRLSVGGFARADADSLCASIKAKGARCFVRASAGDRVASWGHGPQQLAMR